MTQTIFSRFAVLFAFLSFSSPIFAHGDEDHGPAKPAVDAAAGALPSAETHSEIFELVARAEAGKLTIYLDRFADNSPVDQAQVEIESGEWKATAAAVEPGTYQVATPQFAQPGAYPLSFTVTAGEEADLLETTLTVATPRPASTAGNRSSAPYWGGMALLILVGAFVWLKRRMSRSLQGEKS